MKKIILSSLFLVSLRPQAFADTVKFSNIPQIDVVASQLIQNNEITPEQARRIAQENCEYKLDEYRRKLAGAKALILEDIPCQFDNGAGDNYMFKGRITFTR